MTRAASALLGVWVIAGCASVRSEEEVIQEAKDKVFPAVVFIKPIVRDFRSGRMEKVQVFGSGAILSPDGYVVTNNHVAEKATEIKCVLSDREELPARVVGLDPETDLAVLKLDLSQRRSSHPLPVAVFGDSRRLRQGEFVMAMGAPYGFERSVSRGIVSALEQVFDFAPYNLWISTDAAINPGNSGGPLVNIRGEIIGINARSLLFAENLGFAIPSEIVQEVVDRLIRDGKVARSWTGLKLQALRDFSRSSYQEATQGVLVASVDGGSPAEEAQLRAGDLLTAVDGEPLQGLYEKDLPAIERRLAGLAVGRPATFSVRRGDEEMTLRIVPATKGQHEGEDFDCEKWDMTVKEITKFSDPILYFHRPQGVYIQGLNPRGNAHAGGLANLDIIVALGEKRVESLQDARAAYEASLLLEKGRRRILVRLLRRGYPRLAVLDFEKDIEKLDEE